MSVTKPASRRSALLAAITALLIAGSSVMVAPQAAAAGILRPLADVGLDALTSPAARNLLHGAVGTSGLNYGKDGRFTILLLGSDQRESISGVRTDIIMVMSINPYTKQMAALSIPRDIGDVPICNGEKYGPKINGMFADFRSVYPKDDPQRANKALDRMRKELGCTLAIEIDYFAMIMMPAFNVLTDRIGGYRVNIPMEIADSKFQDDPDKPRGIYFPKEQNWLLLGNETPLCNGYYFTTVKNKLNRPGAKCHRAIVYVRTRKGPGNSDFKRQRRAQDVVYSAIRRVIARGDGPELIQLAGAGITQVNKIQARTNLPLNFVNTKDPQNAATALELYALLNGARLSSDRQFVLAPKTYAEGIPGTSKYRLKIAVVRELTKKYFGGVNGASITIVKDAVPNDPKDFDFDATGTGIPADFDLDDDVDATLPNSVTFVLTGAQLGAKTITETAVVGWKLTSLSCTGDADAKTSLANRQVTLNVDNRENIVCTFTNTVTGRPDGRIRLGTGDFVGNNMYDAAATGQALTGSAALGQVVTFGVSVQNDAPFADSFRVRATGTDTTMYDVRYYVGTTEVTAAVVAGKHRTPALAPGATQLITVKVRVKGTATIGSKVSRLLKIWSVADPAVVDAVRFTAKAK